MNTLNILPKVAEVLRILSFKMILNLTIKYLYYTIQNALTKKIL